MKKAASNFKQNYCYVFFCFFFFNLSTCPTPAMLLKNVFRSNFRCSYKQSWVAVLDIKEINQFTLDHSFLIETPPPISYIMIKRTKSIQ